MKCISTEIISVIPCNLFEAQKIMCRALHPIKGETEGYIVTDKNGRQTWCSKTPFDETHKFLDKMNFGQAIEALKQGKKVARKGWNGKGMFLWLKPAAVIKAEWCKDPILKDVAESNGGEIQALGTICMYTHDSTGRKAILTGWLASQSDMLLEDWEIVED